MNSTPPTAVVSAGGPIAAPAPVPNNAPTPPAETYTAVVHFHGIGQQRHYESVAQLVEALHDWVWDHYKRGDEFFVKREFRGLWRMKVKREPARSKGGKEQGPERVVYVQTEAPPAPGEEGNTRVRFYEAYWAPETVKGTTATAVGWWLLKQARRPLQLLLTRWNTFDRIRIADLVGMHQSLRFSGADKKALEEVERLAESYRSFVGRRGDGPAGFQVFVERLAEPLKPLAITWHVAFRRKQLVHLLVTVLVLAAAGAAFGLVLLAIVWGLGQLVDFPQLTAWLPDLAKKIQPTWENALALAPVLLAALGIKRFLGDHVGDVQQYVSYEETDTLYERRRRVLAAAIRQLEHVLCDPACERVLIVAHSLGTAVAFETLRDLAERNIAHDGADPFKGPIPLRKIEHFVTLGSPIDKINYFFVALQSKYRIYEVLARSLRGDIGSTPFSKVGRQPHIHWINYWDRGDPISGALESVTGDALGHHDVDNVQVVNVVVPHPLHSHSGYYRNERVVADLFGMTFYRQHSFVAPSRLLAAGDITEARALLARLRKPERPVEAFVRERLSAATRTAIDALDAAADPPIELRHTLAAELNGLLDGPSWFDPQRFDQVKLRPVTRDLLARKLSRYESVQLNRLLLEDAFGEISRAPRRHWLGPGAGSAWQSALLWLQIVIPAALVLALLETLFGWGSVARWTLTIALLALLGGSWLERKRDANWRRLRRMNAQKVRGEHARAA